MHDVQFTMRDDLPIVGAPGLNGRLLDIKKSRRGRRDIRDIMESRHLAAGELGVSLKEHKDKKAHALMVWVSRGGRRGAWRFFCVK